MDELTVHQRHRSASSDFIFRWPLIAILGTVALTVAFAFGGVAALLALIGEPSALYLSFAVASLFASSYAWGYVLSNLGGYPTDERTFPLNFTVWLFRPPPRGSVRAVDQIEPHDIRTAPLYLIGIMFIAILRWFEHFFQRMPESGDIVSIKSPNTRSGYVVGEIVSQTGNIVVFEPFQRHASRPRIFRQEWDDQTPDEIELRRSDYELLKPKLIWRGERSYWSRYSAPVDDAPFPLRALLTIANLVQRRRNREQLHRNKYRAIEFASENVRSMYHDERLRTGDRASSSTRAPSEYS